MAYAEFTGQHTLSLIKRRQKDSHKGTFGTLINFSGSENMPGALYLSSMAALRSGVGLLKIPAPPNLKKILCREIFEAVYISVEEILTSPTNAYLIGCGLGRSQDHALENILTSITKPVVIDADCINYLSANINVLNNIRSQKILTPHPMEMSRLTGLSLDQIQSNREKCAVEFAKKYDCTLVLKGRQTVVAFSDGSYCINTSGNSGLAKGGSGDVLAGIIAGLCTQGYSCSHAAVLGVYVHGLAADRLAKSFGEHGMLPRDISAEVGKILG